MTLPLNPIALKQYVLIKFLGGMTSPAEIAKAAGLDGDGEKTVSNYLSTNDFLASLQRAKKDMAASVVDTIKEQLHAFLDAYIDLAKSCGDPRVRAQVLKDLLDRGGTGATAKVALTTPDMYKRAIAEYIEEPDEKIGGSDPDGDTPLPK